MSDRESPTRAEVVVGVADVGEAIAVATDVGGFAVDRIFPADDPTVAWVSGHGVTLRLERRAGGSGGDVRLAVPAPPPARTVELTDGVSLTFGPPPRPTGHRFAPATHVVSATEGTWVTGRADMQYRDLAPSRLGGAWVASQIRIPVGGPVPDYVHHHEVAFQMIFCRRGRVEVVYAGQGPPFVMEPGDAVLQPPGIRHRVLAASDGMEVIEITGPADHQTIADRSVTLPSAPDDRWSGATSQRFVRHRAGEAAWSVDADGVERCDFGFGPATDGLASAATLRLAAGGTTQVPDAGELRCAYALAGSGWLRLDGGADTALEPDTSVVVPPGRTARVTAGPTGIELLSVSAG